MDKAQIDAMRVFLDLIDGRAKHYASVSVGIIHVLGVSVIPTSTLAAAVEGLRTLVDEAAAKVESTEGGAVGRGEEALRKILYTLKDTAQAAVKNGRQDVRFYATEVNYASVSRMTVFAAVQSIEELLAAAPAEPAKPAEPTVRDFVAALNRANYRGRNDWSVVIIAGDGTQLDADEASGIVRLMADAAKGGA
jgi:hypothetical protein